MVAVETRGEQRGDFGSPQDANGRQVGRRRAIVALGAIVCLSAALRIALGRLVPGPMVFMDELGYHRLAHSIASSGRLALFGEEGLSYSPLYSLVLAPIYALGASAPTAYEWSKVVNAVLMSLAALPIYGIARFVLPRGSSLVAAALSALAPLMFYSALAMSESLAYPLFLVAVWAMLVTIRTPSARADALVLAAIVAASAARIQLVVLYPIAVTAIALAGLLVRDDSSGAARRVGRSLTQHPLIVSAALLPAFAVAIGALLGGGLSPLAGRYAVVRAVEPPPPGEVMKSAAEHLAGLDLALGGVPFAAALVAAYLFARRGAAADVVAFASVALSTTIWLLFEVGYNSAAFAGASDLPRIHERYVFYVVPLFLVALMSTARLRESAPPLPVYLAAAGATALLPALIPFHSVVNITIVADSFGLQLFGEKSGETITPIANATFGAVSLAGTLALVYVLVRRQPHAVAGAVAVVFVLMSALVGARMHSSAVGATDGVLPAQRDWVDRAIPHGEAVLISGAGARPTAFLQTAFHNLSITRVYHVCEQVFGPGEEFGDRKLVIDDDGRVHHGREVVRARYAAVPAGFRLRGRVVARNEPGRLALVETRGGRLRIRPDAARCT